VKKKSLTIKEQIGGSRDSAGEDTAFCFIILSLLNDVFIRHSWIYILIMYLSMGQFNGIPSQLSPLFVYFAIYILNKLQ
jgi:hypothetical protein